jgi:hypothetical protein
MPDRIFAPVSSIHDFFLDPQTRRTDWWTIVILLVTVASFAGAAILWMQHPG